jgi:lysophospholipid acyltransferase (LPLAT)-like uncharacterized protein
MAVPDATNAGMEEPSLRVRLVSRLVYLAIRLLSWTWFLRRSPADLVPARDSEAVVYAFWHGEQGIMIPVHSGLGITALASLSRDGVLVSRVLDLFGYRVARGSSSRGGSAGLDACVDSLNRDISVGITVDGPRGPRHEPHPGAVVMAARTRRSIVYIVSHCTPAVRLRSWDRFEIPWPLARVRIAYGQMNAPEDQPEAIEAARVELRKRMKALFVQISGQ